MNISRFGLFLLLVLPGLSCPGQASYRFGLLPAVNVNYKVSDDFKLNFKVESRQLLKEGIFDGASDGDYEYVLTDISVVASQKTGVNNSLAWGYLLRIRDSELIHRGIQQFTLVRDYSGFRMAHRFRSDQTFFSNAPTDVRARYRATLQFPLNGTSVDPSEFYFKLNNEYLQSFQGGTYDLEIRGVPLLGYQFSDSNKLEGGLDYRWSNFINNPSDHRFWIIINWFLVI